MVGVLDGLGIERAALVGHSVGCMVSQRAAVDLGRRARALAVCGGALAWRPEAAPVFEERVRQARAGRMDEIAEVVARTGLSEHCRAEDPRLLGLMRELIVSNDPSAYAECSAATAVATMEGTEQVACPVLAFCGSEDPVTPPAAAAAIADAATDGRTGVVEGAAHWCQIEDPDGHQRGPVRLPRYPWLSGQFPTGKRFQVLTAKSSVELVTVFTYLAIGRVSSTIRRLDGRFQRSHRPLHRPPPARTST